MSLQLGRGASRTRRQLHRRWFQHEGVFRRGGLHDCSPFLLEVFPLCEIQRRIVLGEFRHDSLLSGRAGRPARLKPV